MEQQKKDNCRWPDLIPEPTRDPPLEPVIFGDNNTDTPAPVIVTDPLGSYTGVPVDDSSPVPVQDADDL